MADKDDKKKKKEDEKNKGEGDGEATGADPKNTETGGKEIDPVPYSRFKEVNDRSKAQADELALLKKEKADAEKAKDNDRTAKLKEKEEFEKLAGEWEGKYNEAAPKLTAADKELKELRTLLESYAKAGIEKVPELYRDVVADMPLQSRLAWLTENQDKLTEDKPKGIPKTPEGSGKGEMTDDERRAASRRTF